MTAESSRPAILLVTRNLPPLTGGMERLLLNATRGMTEYADVTVIGPRGCRAHLPQDVDVHETSSRLSLFLLGSALLCFGLCITRRFDVVLGGSGLAAPALRLAAMVSPCATAVYLHGLDLVVDSALYQALFLPCIRRVDRVMVNSRNTGALATERGIDATRITVINPGTDLPAAPLDGAIAAFRARRDIPFRQVILFVGRMTRRKGLSAFIRHSLPAITDAAPDAGLVVVGEDPADSLNQLGEHDEVVRAVAASPCADRIRFLGHLDDEALLTCYALADVQVLPLVDVPGDIEGFGMIAVEAAACGTPTVAFALGGVTDAIDARSGALVTPGDYDAFTAAVTSHLGGGDADACREHAERFAWPHFHARVRAVLTGAPVSP